MGHFVYSEHQFAFASISILIVVAPCPILVIHNVLISISYEPFAEQGSESNPAVRDFRGNFSFLLHRRTECHFFILVIFCKSKQCPQQILEHHRGESLRHKVVPVIVHRRKVCVKRDNQGPLSTSRGGISFPLRVIIHRAKHHKVCRDWLRLRRIHDRESQLLMRRHTFEIRRGLLT